jgi:hypothetical protein
MIHQEQSQNKTTRFSFVEGAVPWEEACWMKADKGDVIWP